MGVSVPSFMRSLTSSDIQGLPFSHSLLGPRSSSVRRSGRVGMSATLAVVVTW